MVDYNKLDLQIENICPNTCVIRAIKPTNVKEEKEKFFKSTTYNPQFTYAKTNVYVGNTAKLKFPKTPLGRLLKKKKDDELLRVAIIESIGTETFADLSIKLYGKPDASLVKRALNHARRKTVKKKPSIIPSREVIFKFRKAFIMYGLDWKITTKEMIASAAVSGDERTLFIKKGGKFSKDFIRQLIVHEIGTHVMRVQNGSVQPYKIFESGLPGYLATEEGLAVYNQEINNCMNEHLFKMYAGRVLAVHRSISYSFRDTFTYLRKYFSKEDAWRLTLRAKRGLSDTSKPGSFTKDHLYLLGYYKVKEYMKKGGDYDVLYYGKIGVEHAKLMSQIPGLISPSVMPLFRYFGFFISILESTVTFPIKLINWLYDKSINSFK